MKIFDEKNPKHIQILKEELKFELNAFFANIMKMKFGKICQLTYVLAALMSVDDDMGPKILLMNMQIRIGCNYLM
jgi:hypothetical protein